MSLRDKEQVAKVICHKGSTAAAHGRFTSIVFARCASVHPHVTHASYAPPSTMAALRSRCGHNIFALWFFLSYFFLFFLA